MRGVVRQWDSTPFAGCRVLDRLNPTIGSALTDNEGRYVRDQFGVSLKTLPLYHFRFFSQTSHLLLRHLIILLVFYSPKI